jgi:hypothetical protein
MGNLGVDGTIQLMWIIEDELAYVRMLNGID